MYLSSMEFKMRFRRAALVALNRKNSCCAKLKVRIVAAVVYGSMATSCSADALVEIPSVGSGGTRPGSVGSSKAISLLA